MSDVYEYVAASICKAVQTMRQPQAHQRTQPAYDEAAGGLTKMHDVEYWLEAKNEGGVYFRYAVRTDSGEPNWGSWHELPTHLCNRVNAYLWPGDTVRGISGRYQELDRFV